MTQLTDYRGLVLFITSLALAGGGCATEEKYDLSPSNLPELDDFSGAIDQPPKAKTLYALARILANQGKDNQCQYVLVRLLKEHPKFLPAFNDLAELHLRADRADRALVVLDAGLKVSAKDAVLHNNMGMCWLMMGEHAKALDAFTRAAALEPKDARYRANMAAAMGLQKRYLEALALYKQVLPAAEAHYNLAVICESVNDGERAAAEYKRAQELDDRVQFAK